MGEQLLSSLRAAVEAAPDDLPLRLHFAELLLGAGEHEEAVRQAAVVLQRDPSNEDARAVIAGQTRHGAPATSEGVTDVESAAQTLARLDKEFADVAPPMFVDSQPGLSAFDPETAGVRLADVGGMNEVKARLEASFLAPLRNPELVKLYGKSLRGGLLLYGPPGCGKTFIARALAGEMDATFLQVGLADVLDMWVGQSERNLHELFETARRNAPCVVFLDEVDALGQKRSQMRHSAARGTVNQLLSEMDGMQ